MDKTPAKLPHEVESPADDEVTYEIEGDTPAGAAEPESSGPEVEVIDDTPEKDRGRTPAEPPTAVTDDELESYSEKVRKRIQHFSRGYHDERRAREEATREREAAIEAARALKAENEQLRNNLSQGQTALVAQAKKAAELEAVQAKANYRAAYEAGDPDRIADAQQALTAATMRVERLSNFKPPAVQTPKNEVQIPQPAPAQVTDPKADSWRQDNPWFGADEEMTAFALGLHNKLVREGVDPQSDTYYARINARMRQVFPDSFESNQPADKPARAKPGAVVAPATRSTAPAKIVLTKSQVAIAKRLGVPLDAYAKQVALQMRKENV